VHSAVLGGPKFGGGGNWRMKRSVTAVLLKLGVKRLFSTGKRYFTGIEFKDVKR
jgi:hypothetical protein